MQVLVLKSGHVNLIRCKPPLDSLMLDSNVVVRRPAEVGKRLDRVLLRAAARGVLDLTAQMWLFYPVFDCDRVENRL